MTDLPTLLEQLWTALGAFVTAATVLVVTMQRLEPTLVRWAAVTETKVDDKAVAKLRRALWLAATALRFTERVLEPFALLRQRHRTAD